MECAERLRDRREQRRLIVELVVVRVEAPVRDEEDLPLRRKPPRTEITFAISFRASATGLSAGNGVAIGGAPASADSIALYQSIAFESLPA